MAPESEPGRASIVVDVTVTVWTADAHHYRAFEVDVLPRLAAIYGDLRATGRVVGDDPVGAFLFRFPVRVEAADAHDAAATTKRCVQQVMRGAGVRGVVSVPDGWPVS